MIARVEAFDATGQKESCTLIVPGDDRRFEARWSSVAGSLLTFIRSKPAPACDPSLLFDPCNRVTAVQQEPTFSVGLPVHACYHAGGHLAQELNHEPDR